ncbi:glycosyl transferase [Chryseobacterium taklimakanense]|uniref:glycosyltransferase family 32 protein n=1 Tax=Chryseobacterium taklimakanense TaxID=536441 RepID=UPI001EF69FD5|nr:glycosyltransferase [Chryseobacterium taklimakanense]MCG7281477.1 glycosyl transferase [Chryseobacterium taklimakanense]
MIPKKIHYCWFGGNPKPESFHICLDSWKKNLLDYEIIEWNETNFDINCCEYVRLAAEKKKWAFVSDYARALALFEQGGIYMDIDVEVKHNLDEFLHHRAFSGFEMKGSPFTALWATEAGHPWPQKVLEFYDAKTDFDLTTNTVYVSELLVKHYGVDPERDEYQELRDGIAIYPSSYFCLDLPRNYAAHHFIGTWHKRDTPNPFKDLVHAYFYLSELPKQKNIGKEIHNIINNQKLITSDEILDQFPLKMLVNNVLRRIKGRIL